MNTHACSICYLVGTKKEIDSHDCPGFKGRFERMKTKPYHYAGQTKKHSAFEAIANVAIGFGVSVAANMIVLPWFGYKVNAGNAIGIGVIFTGISILRSYVLRRIFNRITIRRGQ